MSDWFRTCWCFRTFVSARLCQDELLTLLIDVGYDLHKAIVCSHDQNFEAVGLWQGRWGLLYRSLFLIHFRTIYWHSDCLIRTLVLFGDTALILFLLLYQLLLLLCGEIDGTWPFCSFVGALLRPQLTEIVFRRVQITLLEFLVGTVVSFLLEWWDHCRPDQGSLFKNI